MKFYIDGAEIKTVTEGAEITGGFDLPSRTALFSYVYNNESYMKFEYKVKVGSHVVIKNDNDNKIFTGKVTEITYFKDKNLIKIQAQDMFYELVKRKIKGRYKGTFISILKDFMNKYKITSSIITKITTVLQKEINILSLGKLSVYDIVLVAARKIFGKEIKLYLDGESRIHVLIPRFLDPAANFSIGKNIIDVDFSANEKNNFSSLTVNGDENVVSGSVVSIEDENGNKGIFIVQKDRHIYGNIYKTVLTVKERKLIS